MASRVARGRVPLAALDCGASGGRALPLLGRRNESFDDTAGDVRRPALPDDATPRARGPLGRARRHDGRGQDLVGKRLAGRLGLPFVDADAEIEAGARMTIPEIFEKFGEPYFRDGERRVIARLLEEGPCVLSTGGGAFMNAVDARAHRASAASRSG